jgi:hypothetical protein
MPDERRHRGPHPEDPDLFSREAEHKLRDAVADLSWLLTREYATRSALKVVGDRYDLAQRQRTAVMRSACSDQARTDRQQRRVPPEQLRGQPLLLDGYNVLTTIEAALAGGVLIVGRDGAWRDMASIHGTYRKVEETVPAIALVGDLLAELGTGPCTWYLDSPVSNSGRLKTILADVARERSWNWRIELVPNPDRVLIESRALVATADSVILDGCAQWVNVAGDVVQRRIPAAHVLNLSG